VLAEILDLTHLSAGIASPAVTLADPATGTGTFLLGILRRIADTIKADEGEGAVKEAINAAVKRLIAFEMQLGPFAVATLEVEKISDYCCSFFPSVDKPFSL
jgi:hypothetical protein